MIQKSMFETVPDKALKPKRAKAVQLDMFGGDLTGGGVTKLECRSETREKLVLRRPGETDEERLDREAREVTQRMF